MVDVIPFIRGILPGAAIVSIRHIDGFMIDETEYIALLYFFDGCCFHGGVGGDYAVTNSKDA